MPHAHAHVVPMHAKTDITSARYVTEPEALRMSAEHLLADRATLLRVREELGFAPKNQDGPSALTG